MRTPTKKFPYRGETATIGEGGCYIEVLESFKPDTIVQVVFWLDNEKICALAEVVTNHRHIGNGLRFVGMEPTAAEKLRNFLNTAGQQNRPELLSIAAPSIFDVTIATYSRNKALNFTESGVAVSFRHFSSLPSYSIESSQKKMC
jgi:PilZ domain